MNGLHAFLVCILKIQDFQNIQDSEAVQETGKLYKWRMPKIR